MTSSKTSSLVDRTAAAARTRLTSELSIHVNEIDRVCRLTEAQKKKLHLAGRGDIHRFFDRYETAKEQLKLGRENAQKINVQIANAEKPIIVEIDQDVLQVAAPLHADHIGGFFMLMQALWLERRRKPLPVYLPPAGMVGV